MGRSIGSGPATYLAAHKSPGILILVSPFTSIQDIVKDFIGKYLMYAVKDRFNNLQLFDHIKCPTFLLHGIKDPLISPSHS